MHLIKCFALDCYNRPNSHCSPQGEVLLTSACPDRLKRTAEVVGDNVRRAAEGVDSKFDVSGKAAKATQE